MNEETIIMNGRAVTVEFEYDAPDPLVGYLGGYGIMSVADAQTGEQLSGYDINIIEIELEALRCGRT